MPAEKTYTIYVLPDEKEIIARDGNTLLESSLSSGIPHTHICGGKAKCSTCRVVVISGLGNCLPRTEAEQEMAEKLSFSPQVRLACQTRVKGSVVLRRTVLDTLDITLASQLGSGPKLSSVGEEKSLAILFSDISEYTSFAEALPAYDVIHALRRYFFSMGKIIHEHGGLISDYVGDGLMALFGVDDKPDPVYRAVTAGFTMLKEVDQLNPYLQAMYKKRFQVRLGIHYGTVVVGTIGAINMEKIAAIGDPVNVASRIEEANKKTETSMLISDAALREIFGRVRIRQTFKDVILRGKRQKFTLHEVGDLVQGNELGVKSEALNPN